MCALRLTALPEPFEPGRLRPSPDFRPWAVGAYRSRATLIPLTDEYSDDPWFLGATGHIAHRPPPPGSLQELLHRRAGDRGLPPDNSACGVFLTQILAGPDVQRCGLCEMTTMPRTTSEDPMT